MEIYKVIVEYKKTKFSRYSKREISNLGNIRDTNKKTNEVVIHKGSTCGKYKYLNLTNTSIGVHRLVAKYFISASLGNNDVDHIDTNTFNNKAVNLEIVNHQENCIRRSRHYYIIKKKRDNYLRKRIQLKKILIN
jgi:hypothetical protein